MFYHWQVQSHMPSMKGSQAHLQCVSPKPEAPSETRGESTLWCCTDLATVFSGKKRLPVQEFQQGVASAKRTYIETIQLCWLFTMLAGERVDRKLQFLLNVFGKLVMYFCVWGKCWILHAGVWWGCAKGQKPPAGVWVLQPECQNNRSLGLVRLQSYLYSFIKSKLLSWNIRNVTTGGFPTQGWILDQIIELVVRG